MLSVRDICPAIHHDGIGQGDKKGLPCEIRTAGYVGKEKVPPWPVRSSRATSKGPLVKGNGQFPSRVFHLSPEHIIGREEAMSRCRGRPSGSS